MYTEIVSLSIILCLTNGNTNGRVFEMRSSSGNWEELKTRKNSGISSVSGHENQILEENSTSKKSHADVESEFVLKFLDSIRFPDTERSPTGKKTPNLQVATLRYKSKESSVFEYYYKVKVKKGRLGMQRIEGTVVSAGKSCNIDVKSLAPHMRTVPKILLFPNRCILTLRRLNFDALKEENFVALLVPRRRKAVKALSKQRDVVSIYYNKDLRHSLKRLLKRGKSVFLGITVS